MKAPQIGRFNGTHRLDRGQVAVRMVRVDGLRKGAAEQHAGPLERVANGLFDTALLAGNIGLVEARPGDHVHEQIG